MSGELFDRLKIAIDKYEQKSYDEHDFHSTLESIIQTITELDLSNLRDFLSGKEGDLERIDFMINEEDKRREYLKTIKRIKDYLSQ